MSPVYCKKNSTRFEQEIDFEICHSGNLPPIEWYALAGSGLQQHRAAAVDDRCADPEMLRPHHSADPNWGHSELGAQSGRKNQPACLCVCLSAGIYPETHARSLPNLLCMLPMCVARSSSGTLTIGRIACRREGGDRSAQRGQSVIYDCVVVIRDGSRSRRRRQRSGSDAGRPVRTESRVLRGHRASSTSVGVATPSPPVDLSLADAGTHVENQGSAVSRHGEAVHGAQNTSNRYASCSSNGLRSIVPQ